MFTLLLLLLLSLLQCSVIGPTRVSTHFNAVRIKERDWLLHRHHFTPTADHPPPEAVALDEWANRCGVHQVGAALLKGGGGRGEDGGEAAGAT